jgi:hypothetical protein
MSSYTVHMPPAKADKPEPDPQSFIFVRDGFSFWAFLLGPLWMLRHRLWLVCLVYVALVILLSLGLQATGAANSVTFAAGALLALLVGLEAASLRRLTLAWRRWRNVGVVVADDLEAAERRFFDAWTRSEHRGALAGTGAAPAAGHPIPAAGTSEIVGLFPQPGAPR